MGWTVGTKVFHPILGMGVVADIDNTIYRHGQKRIDPWVKIVRGDGDSSGTESVLKESGWKNNDRF